LFWQAGVLRARTLEELLDAAALFASQPLPAGNRVAVLTNAGGLGILCADACDGAGLELPALSDETRQGLRAVLPAEASVADPGVDAVIVLFVPPVVATATDVSAAIARTAEGSDKPVLPVVMSAEGTP